MKEELIKEYKMWSLSTTYLIPTNDQKVCELTKTLGVHLFMSVVLVHTKQLTRTFK